MRQAFPVCLLLAASPLLAQEDLWLRGPDTAFCISREHGSVVFGQRANTPLIGNSYDLYRWVTDEGEMLLDESADVVTDCEARADSIHLVCRVPGAELTIHKQYWLAAGGRALAKRFTVPALGRRGVFRVRSAVTLPEAFRNHAWYYCQRQSWTTGPERNLFGVRKATEIGAPVTSGAGWDPRLVVAFDEAQAVGHYRLAVRGQYVPPSSVVQAYGVEPENTLRYTPTGWDFELVHTVDGEPGPVDATVMYHLCAGDFRDLWREYRELPEFRETMAYSGPAWAVRTTVGGFWNIDPRVRDTQLADAHALARRLGEGALPLGAFAWSLDGDYETDTPFLTEGGGLILTPEYFGESIRAMQSDPRVKIGTYFQGGLIDSDTRALAKHPEWAMQTPEGKPFFSGFRDNPLGEMYFFNVLSPFVEHFLERVRAVCQRYRPGWIYLDGGAMFESTDWRLRRPVLPDNWMRFHRRLRETIQAADPECALLMNAQNMPYGDLYWLECGYFRPDAPWRETIEFCYEAEIHHEPTRPMLPLYWHDEPRYLAMCVAFGFTPTYQGLPASGDFSPAQWRAIDAAFFMRPGRLVLRAGAVSPDFMRQQTDIVAFAEQLPEWVVIPVLSMGEARQATVELSLSMVGLPAQGAAHRVQVVRPLADGKVIDLGRLAAHDGKLAVTVDIIPGWNGLTLIAVGDADLPLARLPAAASPAEP